MLTFQQIILKLQTYWSDHGCALLHNGSIWCWGSNQAGALGVASVGEGDGAMSTTPVRAW